MHAFFGYFLSIEEVTLGIEAGEFYERINIDDWSNVYCLFFG